MISLEDQLRLAERRLATAQDKLVLELAWHRRDWSSYVLAHPLAGQLDALVRVLEQHGASRADTDAKLSTVLPGDLALLVRTVWFIAGRHERAAQWSWVLRVLRNSGQHLGHHADQVHHAALPESVTIYRGFTSRADDAMSHARGFSWSTDRAVAVRYAYATSEPFRSFVARVTVPQTMILAYLATAGEDEVVIDRPDEMQGIVIEQIDHERPVGVVQLQHAEAA